MHDAGQQKAGRRLDNHLCYGGERVATIAGMDSVTLVLAIFVACSWCAALVAVYDDGRGGPDADNDVDLKKQYVGRLSKDALEWTPGPLPAPSARHARAARRPRGVRLRSRTTGANPAR